MQSARARLFAQVTFAAVFAFAALATPAHAYLGEQMLSYAANYFLAPLALIAVVVALAASYFRPEFVQKAIYVILISLALFAVIKSGNLIMSALQAGV